MKPNYLRISVIDRCNLNCIYCKPYSQQVSNWGYNILSADEIEHLARVFAKSGINSVRLTGGEPLYRKDIIEIIGKISKIESIKDLSLTTNGVLLKDLASPLKEAGLKRLNISLNAADRETFEKVSGHNCFEEVLEGIGAALAVGFSPLKINVVILRSINENQIEDFVQLARNFPLSVRFIEYSPVSIAMPSFNRIGVLNYEVKDIIERNFGELYSDNKAFTNGPAAYFKMKNSKGNVGFISGSSENFCGSCNRLRLSCDGKLFSCLYALDYLDLRKLISLSCSAEFIYEKINEFIAKKCDYSKPDEAERCLDMSRIGG